MKPCVLRTLCDAAAHTAESQCSSIPRLLVCRHRGSGASKVKDHHVRENTILSFLKAATNHRWNLAHLSLVRVDAVFQRSLRLAPF